MSRTEFFVFSSRGFSIPLNDEKLNQNTSDDENEKSAVSAFIIGMSQDSYKTKKWSSQVSEIKQIAVGKPAPDFTTEGVVNGKFENVSLSDYKGKYIVLVFYPGLFSYTCPTELIAFSDRIEEFKRIKAEVVTISTNSKFSHLTSTKLPRKERGLGEMRIPLLSDESRKISRDYNVLNEEKGVAYRGMFIIDGKGTIRQITINDKQVGRSVDEALRLVQAFQYSDKDGEFCPVDWHPGDECMIPTPEDSLKYYRKHY